MRTNPFYQNICWYRFGRYQKNKCIGCIKKQECDLRYNDETGEWNYLKKTIPCPYKAPYKVNFRPIPGGIYATEIEPLF